jgi:hypothetical protein
MFHFAFSAMVPTPAALVPCYMNIINIADVVVGEGLLLNLTQLLREYLDKMGWGPYFADCLAAPLKEPHYSLPPPLPPNRARQISSKRRRK